MSFDVTGVCRPRKRLILDWDPVLKRISAQVVVRNRSQESFAFKVTAFISDLFCEAALHFGLPIEWDARGLSVNLFLPDPYTYLRQSNTSITVIKTTSVCDGSSVDDGLALHGKQT